MIKYIPLSLLFICCFIFGGIMFKSTTPPRCESLLQDDNIFVFVVDVPLICPSVVVLRRQLGLVERHRVWQDITGSEVAVHDGVRPLLSASFIRRMWEEAENVPALIPVRPMVETLKVLERRQDGRLVSTGETADRNRIFGAQTPQIFHSEDLKAAYGQGFDTLFTDDASVAERYGIPLTFCDGERYNIKITTPDDLQLANALFPLI